METQSATTLIVTSFLLSIFINGLASSGPIMTTVGFSRKCEEADASCKTNRTWLLTLGIIFIVSALFLTTSSFYFLRKN